MRVLKYKKTDRAHVKGQKRHARNAERLTIHVTKGDTVKVGQPILQIEAVEAALGGLIAGLIGALITVPISLALSMSGDVQAEILKVIDQLQLPPDARDRVSQMLTGPRFMLVTAAVTVPIYAVFGMLGGLLGSAIFRRKTPPPAAPIPAPPPIAPSGGDRASVS